MIAFAYWLAIFSVVLVLLFVLNAIWSPSLSILVFLWKFSLQIHVQIQCTLAAIMEALKVAPIKITSKLCSVSIHMFIAFLLHRCPPLPQLPSICIPALSLSALVFDRESYQLLPYWFAIKILMTQKAIK